MTEIRFVLAPGQNHFFFELAEVLRFELEELGAKTSLSTEGFGEEGDECVYVLVPPHEYFVLEGNAAPPPPGALRRTIFISAEQPESIHFHQNVALALHAGALFDINARAVRAYRRRGLRAQHLRLGYSRSWDHFDPAGLSDRSCDVIFLGAHTERRARVIAACEPVLSGVRSRLVFSDNSRPNPAGSSSYLAGGGKWKALRDARWLLNVHQGPEPYFEWHRILQAILCGTALLTESSTDHAPLEAGTHFAAADAADLPGELSQVLRDDADRERMARDAYALVRSEIPLRRAAEDLAEEAERLGAGGPRRPSLRATVAARTAAARVWISGKRAGRGGTPEPAPASTDLPLRGRPLERDPEGAGSAVELAPDGIEIGTVLSRLPSEMSTILLIEDGQALAPRARHLLEQGLAEDGVAFAFGLVAAGEEIGNAFGWSADRETRPPVLIRTDALRRALAERPEPVTLGEALARAGRGVNVQSFVAREGGPAA